MRRTLAGMFVLAVIMPASLSAQDTGWSNGFWSTTLPAIAGTDTLGLALRGRLQNDDSADTGSDTAATPPTAPADLRYTPSHERRIANFANFVAKSRLSDRQGADNLAKLFASQDVVEGMKAPLDAVGLRIDDVADAYAAWWINAWQASHGRDEDVSRTMAIAVRNQVVEAMASSGMMRSASDAAKQEMAESLLIQAALIAAAMEQSKGNAALTRAIAAVASQGARGMNVDLTAMDLTEHGFVPAR
ncbi:hypothetical protein SAMN02982989_1015 [Xaviernesmea oryzae]|uniref:Uncharacterized protein n=1 Tax=Xaviernesmea oryzae TaxID=464029 RepID=A0A1X7FWR5_9HYPH|nr:DUF6683 family protein [Xaviernesmea oryzae]SMF60056.1 hypothetical protein SAMN02982989_1015 [Xaviernesmea oryzae]